MNEPVPVEDHESVYLQVSLLRPRWGSVTKDTLRTEVRSQAEVVTTHIDMHPDVANVTTLINEWQCPVCDRIYRDKAWYENKQRASECCYEFED